VGLGRKEKKKFPLITVKLRRERKKKVDGWVSKSRNVAQKYHPLREDRRGRDLTASKGERGRTVKVVKTPVARKPVLFSEERES